MGDLFLVGTFFCLILASIVSLFIPASWGRWVAAAAFLAAAPLMGIPLGESGPVGLWTVAWSGWAVLVSVATFAAWRLWGNAPDTTITAATTAETARDAAVTARGEAVTASAEAVTASAAAVTAQGEAVTASAAAVVARDEAAAARTEAAAARTEAVTARGACLTASTKAVTARDEAVAAKGEAVVARDEAAAAQVKAEAAATQVDAFAQRIETMFNAHLVSLDLKECIKQLIRSYVMAAQPTATGFGTARDGSVQVKNLSEAEKGILLVAIDIAGGAGAGLSVNSKIQEVLAKL